MQRVHDLIKTIEPHDSIERYTKLGVEVCRATQPWLTRGRWKSS